MPSKVLFDAGRAYMCNGELLLENLIASCDGKSNSIRHYSAEELVIATNNFHPSFRFEATPCLFRGFLDSRLVIIKKTPGDSAGSIFEAIRDIIISMQMSTHKNVLKLLGCCLEFPTPALVLEYAGKGLEEVLHGPGGLTNKESLTWKTRLSNAKKLANAITYLHTAFPRPIIHRNLGTHCIMLDDDFVPKLCDFSLSITIPPDESHVVAGLVGTRGWIDPEYRILRMSSHITEKTDVYGFGLILLVFLTGRRPVERDQEGENTFIIPFVKLHAGGDDQMKKILDPRLLEELNGDNKQEEQQQLHDFLALALSCVQLESKVRPEMINVAKELLRIERSILP